MPVRNKRVCSSAWLERTPDKGEVGGSSPPRPTIHLNRPINDGNTFNLIRAIFQNFINY